MNAGAAAAGTGSGAAPVAPSGGGARDAVHTTSGMIGDPFHVPAAQCAAAAHASAHPSDSQRHSSADQAATARVEASAWPAGSVSSESFMHSTSGQTAAPQHTQQGSATGSSAVRTGCTSGSHHGSESRHSVEDDMRAPSTEAPRRSGSAPHRARARRDPPAPPRHLSATASSRNKTTVPPPPPASTRRRQTSDGRRHEPPPPKPPLVIKSTRASRGHRKVPAHADSGSSGHERQHSAERRFRQAGSAPGAARSSGSGDGRRPGELSSTRSSRSDSAQHKPHPKPPSGTRAESTRSATADGRSVGELRREVARLDLLHDEVMRRLQEARGPGARFELQKGLQEVRAALLRTGRELLARQQ
eukprot:jgi/Ulvmu1/989/UM103_0016.1